MPRSLRALLSCRFFLVLILGFLGLLAGCAGSNSGGGSSTPSTPITATPAISSISPTKLNAGSADLTLTVSGSGFISSSTVDVGSTAEATTYVSATQLTATVPAAQLRDGAELPVVVSNASILSPSVSLEVDNPAPVISSMTPTTELAGTASAVLTVTGTGFVPSTVVEVNGSARTTTFINSTQVSVALPTSDFVAAGSLSITAVNPTPGGGTSAASSLSVPNPPVGAIKVTPSVLDVGATSATTVTVNGTGFVAASVVSVSGTARATTYVNGTTLTFAATVADQATMGVLPVIVSNPAPGGGTSAAAALNIVVPPATPVLTSLTPSSLLVGSGATSIIITGTGFTPNTVAQWNGVNLTTSYGYSFGSSGYLFSLIATIPASDTAAAGTATVTASTPGANPAVSNALTESITNPPVPTLTSLSPSGGPINTASVETLTGTGFTTNTTVALNGVILPSTWVNSTQITVTFPASSLAFPGNLNVTLTTPAPGGGTSAAQVFTSYISTAVNDIVWNSVDGLLWASIPASSAGATGNAVVGIDPYTGTTMRTIQVGTNPNKLALSSDGTQLFVGIDGAAAVAQINLAQGTIVNQFSLGGGQGYYDTPYTALYLAALPGEPNSVAVATIAQLGSGGQVTIFDSGVARSGSSVTNEGEGPMSFGSSASTLYLGSGYIDALTVGSTGITGLTQVASPSFNPTWIQYDNGSLYLSTGQVLNSSTSALNGTFYSTGTTVANGPVVSDSSLGKAFLALANYLNYNNGNGIYVFDESSFSNLGMIPVNALGTQGYPTSFEKVVRWGQNGLAAAAVPSVYSTTSQIYIFQSPLVKDVSASPSDLTVSLTAPAAAVTGTAISYVASVVNNGPNAATGVTLAVGLDASLIVNSVTASQGTCTTAASFTCDLGGLANGSTATVTVNATATTSGTLASVATVSSSSYDPTSSNNQANGSTTATGSGFSPVPSIASLSPNLVQAGGAAFTLTVNGSGFNSASTVNLGGSALVTTFVSSTQLTASVPATGITNYGWSAVTVSNASPGGGVSAVAPLTIYDLVNVPVNSILFDPWGQSLYATVPSTATGFTANSVVAINPATGVVGTPVALGSQPTVMAETSDGNYLYVSLNGSDSLAKFDLQAQSLTATIPLSYQSSGVTATSLAAMPGTDNTVAVGITNSWSNFAILDVSGSTGTFRPNVSGIYAGVNPIFASPTELYAYDNQTSSGEFYRYSINASGLTEIDGTTLDGMGGFSGGFQGVNNLIYGDGGGIINPTTTPPTQVQTLPALDFYEEGSQGYGVGVLADPSLNKDFLMEENTAGTWAYGLVRYDLKSYLPESYLVMPTPASGVESQWTMQRFGQDGIALLSYDNPYVTTPAVQLMLLRGPFVAPQELSTSTAATLSSAASIPHGSGNTALTLTGANFLPGVAVIWNGSYRTTTIVDSTHVTVLIPASDVSASGTASLVATNPGAPASTALSVTIN